MFKKLAFVLAIGSASNCVLAQELVVYTAGPKGLANKLIKDYKSFSGVDVQMYQATTGRVLGRLKAEQEKPIADVVILASWPAAMGLQSENLLHSFEAKNADKLQKNWNSNNELFGYSGSALGITYNTRVLDQAPASLSAYSDAKWNGKVVIPDPTESGSALDFIAGFVADDNEKAWRLFSQWQENDIEVKGANRPALNQVVSGAKSLVIGGVDYMGYAEKNKGNPIEVIYPEEGTVIAPRPAMVLKSSQNIEGAEAFIEYLLSERAQKVVANGLLLPGRIDIAAHASRPGYNDIKQLNYDWQWMFANQTEVTQKFSTLFR